MCLGNTGQTPLAQRLMMPGDTFIICYKAIDGNYCVTLDIRTHPGLQSKKHHCSYWLCVLLVPKFWTHNTDAGLCITESKQSKTTQIWWNLNKTIHIFTVADGFVCAQVCEIWDVVNCGRPTVAGQLWPFPLRKWQQIVYNGLTVDPVRICTLGIKIDTSQTDKFEDKE